VEGLGEHAQGVGVGAGDLGQVHPGVGGYGPGEHVGDLGAGVPHGGGRLEFGVQVPQHQPVGQQRPVAFEGDAGVQAGVAGGQVHVAGVEPADHLDHAGARVASAPPQVGVHLVDDDGVAAAEGELGAGFAGLVQAQGEALAGRRGHGQLRAGGALPAGDVVVGGTAPDDAR
jgi:hypothetical protein